VTDTKLKREVLHISIGYILFAGLWILLSDRVLVAFVSDPNTFSMVSTYKGWAFVIVTGLLLYGALHNRLRRWHQEMQARLEAEQSLHESEERYRIAIESSQDAVAMVRNDSLVFTNRRFLVMFGYDSAEEVLGSSLFVNVHPNDRPMVAQLMEDKKKDRSTPGSFEYRGITKDGITRWIEATVANITYLGQTAGLAYLRDVTERKKMEETLRESETALRAILIGSRDAVAVSSNGIHTFANPAYAALFGYETADELIGTPVANLLPSLDNAREYTTIDKENPGDEPVPFNEILVKKKDGAAFFAEVTLSSYALKNEDFTLSILRDATARRKAEDHIRASLAEKEVLLREIHHRVKNNLAVITGILSLQANSATDQRVTDILTECQNRVRAMAEVHTQLYHSQNLAMINFGEYLDRLANDIFQNNRYDKDIALRITADPIPLDIDHAIPLGLIVNEMITNSLKHAFSGRKGGKLAVSLSRSKEDVILTVSDDGIGFPTDVDYRKTETLGMRLVTALVQQIDGAIELRNDEGTTFIVTFAA
jgi:PAS domain S-box-containing protein